jgi:hypothetical protein
VKPFARSLMWVKAQQELRGAPIKMAGSKELFWQIKAVRAHTTRVLKPFQYLCKESGIQVGALTRLDAEKRAKAG